MIIIKIKRLIKSFVYAFRGLFKIFREEQNLQIQIIAGLFVILLAWLFQINRVEWCLFILVTGLVILTETINSAIERVTDVLKPRINGYVKEIKDIMAAAVMISSVIAVVVGLIVLGPYLIRFFSNLA